MTSIRLERLERRDNPAGTVAATLSGSTWTIAGDDEANEITILPGGGQGGDEFILLGTGTAVAGETTPAGVKNIVIRMGGGDDVVFVNDGAARVALAGKLTVDGGNGANVLRVNRVSVGKDLVVSNGTNSSAENGQPDDLFLTDSDVGGKLTVRNGDGDTRTIISRSTPGVSTIRRGLSFTSGTGRDQLEVRDTHIGGNVAIDVGLPDDIDFPGLVFFQNEHNTTAQSLIAGNVSVKVGGGSADSAGVVRLTDLEVRGNVRIDNLAAKAGLTVDASNVPQPALVRGNVTITTQGGIVALGAAVSGPGNGFNNTGVTVGKRLTLDAGDAVARVVLNRANVRGKTSIVTGDAGDTIVIDDSAFGTFALSTGDGDDLAAWETRVPDGFESTFDSATRFNGKTTVDMGAGTDTLTLGADANEPATRVEFFGPTILHGGADADVCGDTNVAVPLGSKLTIDFES